MTQITAYHILERESRQIDIIHEIIPPQKKYKFLVISPHSGLYLPEKVTNYLKTDKSTLETMFQWGDLGQILIYPKLVDIV